MTMSVGLFIPCYINHFFPQVGVATLFLLEQQGIEVEYPLNQSCCGQPMGNSGCACDAEKSAEQWVDQFKSYDTIVCPSGSCVAFIRHQYGFLKPSEALEHARANTFELCEYLVDVVQEISINADFNHSVGLHNCCHGHRGLGLAKSSEIVGAEFSKLVPLLNRVKGLELKKQTRPDECCGFGGTFSVYEEAASCKMGLDRITDFEQTGAEYITGVDMSCLMHLDGLIRRHQKKIRVKHIAEILAGDAV